MAKLYPDQITIVRRGGQTRVVTWKEWTAGDTEACRAQARFDLGRQAGTGVFSLAHGWGQKPLDDWRIAPDDQDKLIAWADAEAGRRISKMPRSPGRRVRPKTGPKVRKEQVGFAWGNDQDRQGSGTSAKR